MSYEDNEPTSMRDESEVEKGYLCRSCRGCEADVTTDFLCSHCNNIRLAALELKQNTYKTYPWPWHYRIEVGQTEGVFVDMNNNIVPVDVANAATEWEANEFVNRINWLNEHRNSRKGE